MRLTVASYNLHCGVDGWGRPYDVVDVCRSFAADVLVLQETWTPEGGGGPVAEVAGALGYHVTATTLATGRLAGPNPEADDRWMRRVDWQRAGHALYLDGVLPLPERITSGRRFRDAQPGAWGVAVLTREPHEELAVIELGHLRTDRAERRTPVVRLPTVGGLVVAGAHMAHLTHGSPVQFRRLSRALSPLVGEGPAVLAGDMNLWGPPVTALLPGWRRAVKGRTWPAWRPHSQVDHVLVRGPVRVRRGEVRPPAGSDHRPVVVQLEVAA